jgi:glycosyltransferase involved in cell wall biosynthesis
VGDRRVDPQAFARFLALREQLGVDGITVQSALGHAELVDVYRSARLFVLPSEQESFCMPVAEAQACGVPVLARGIPAVRETGGEGARYLDGDDPAAWTDAMLAMLEDQAALDALRAAGIANARRFTWERTAEGLAAHLLPAA